MTLCSVHPHVPKQECATQEQSLSKMKESNLEDKIKSLEAEKSDLTTAVDKLEKNIMQLEEIRPSDIEWLIKVHICVWAAHLCVYIRYLIWCMAYVSGSIRM